MRSSTAINAMLLPIVSAREKQQISGLDMACSLRKDDEHAA